MNGLFINDVSFKHWRGPDVLQGDLVSLVEGLSPQGRHANAPTYRAIIGVMIAPPAPPTPAPIGPARANPATPPAAPPVTASCMVVQPVSKKDTATMSISAFIGTPNGKIIFGNF